MNTDNNARFQETERKIKQAYGVLAQKKLSSKITVSDICREAKIHRTTFYGHYEDVIDLMDQVEVEQFIRLLNEFRLDDDWDLYRGVLAITIFFNKYKKIIRKHFTEMNRMDAWKFFKPETVDSLAEKYGTLFHCKSEAELRYHQSFYAAGVMSVLSEWLNADCRETPEEMAEIICRLLEHRMAE